MSRSSAMALVESPQQLSEDDDLGIPDIDGDHTEIMTMLDRLLTAEDSEVAPLFNALSLKIVAHFYREAFIAHQYGIELDSLHSAEHGALTDCLLSYLCDVDPARLRHAAATDIRPQLIAHLHGPDRALAARIKAAEMLALG